MLIRVPETPRRVVQLETEGEFAQVVQHAAAWKRGGQRVEIELYVTDCDVCGRKQVHDLPAGARSIEDVLAHPTALKDHWRFAEALDGGVWRDDLPNGGVKAPDRAYLLDALRRYGAKYLDVRVSTHVVFNDSDNH